MRSEALTYRPWTVLYPKIMQMQILRARAELVAPASKNRLPSQTSRFRDFENSQFSKSRRSIWLVLSAFNSRAHWRVVLCAILLLSGPSLHLVHRRVLVAPAFAIVPSISSPCPCPLSLFPSNSPAPLRARYSGFAANTQTFPPTALTSQSSSSQLTTYHSPPLLPYLLPL